MQSSEHFSIRAKVLVSFALAGVITLATGWYVHLKVLDVIDTQTEIRRRAEVVSKFELLLHYVIDLENGLRGYLISSDASYLEHFNEAEESFERVVRESQQIVGADSIQRRRLAKLQELKRSWIEGPAIDQAIAGRRFERGLLPFAQLRDVFTSGSGKQITDEARGIVEAARAREQEALSTLIAESISSIRSTESLTSTGFVLVALVSFAIFLLFVGAVFDRLEQAVQVLERFAGGDLDCRVKVASKDEVGRIATAVNKAIDGARSQILKLSEAHRSAEEASKTKSEFLASMSHEIRTPLGGISSLSELLLHEDLSEGQRRDVLQIRSCVRSLKTVIDDILDFSKIEAGKLDIEQVEFSLPDLLQSNVDLLKPAAREKGLSLNLAISDSVPLKVVSDSTRVSQILNNLIGNAIKFTPAGGEIDVSVALEPQNPSGRLLLFSVRDTGIGIPEDKLELIFEKFTQADSSTTREFGGTGLGLGICNRLASLMGGRIWVESVLGEGSTFYFTIRFGAVGDELGLGGTPSLAC